jgi:hypothetical protein
MELVVSLIMRARGARKDAAIITWANQVADAAEETRISAKGILEENSTNYTMEELNDELEMLHKRGQQLGEWQEIWLVLVSTLSMKKWKWRCWSKCSA